MTTAVTSDDKDAPLTTAGTRGAVGAGASATADTIVGNDSDDAGAANSGAATTSGAAASTSGGNGVVVVRDGIADLSGLPLAALTSEVEAIIKDLWRIYAGKLPSWRHEAYVVSPTLMLSHPLHY